MWIAYSRETGINHDLRVAIVKNQIGSSLEHFRGNDSEIDFVTGQIRDLARLHPRKPPRSGVRSGNISSW